jgi:hypothetical protein
MSNTCEEREGEFEPRHRPRYVESGSGFANAIVPESGSIYTTYVAPRVMLWGEPDG